jgi:hypothetical protein
MAGSTSHQRKGGTPMTSLRATSGSEAIQNLDRHAPFGGSR